MRFLFGANCGHRICRQLSYHCAFTEELAFTLCVRLVARVCQQLFQSRQTCLFYSLIKRKPLYEYLRVQHRWLKLRRSKKFNAKRPIS